MQTAPQALTPSILPKHLAAALLNLVQHSTTVQLRSYSSGNTSRAAAQALNQQHSMQLRQGQQQAPAAMHTRSSSARTPHVVGRVTQRRSLLQCRALHSSSSSSNGSFQHNQQAGKTGYLWHELYFWHNAGPWGNFREHVQPMDHSPEHVETKRRLHNLVTVSGLLDELQVLKPRPATLAELSRAHSIQYVETVEAMSEDYSKNIHRVGDESAFMPGGFEIAALAAGGAITATDAVLAGQVANAYVLCRPPGHHAERDNGGGYCIFNNIAVAAHHALAHHQVDRVAIVDFDVHHGNGTQAIFEQDDRVLFISLHQASNYPTGSGGLDEVGTGPGKGFTLNVPLPPGSGSGAYRAAFDRVVGPALEAYRPQLILVSAGYDASYMDPLGQMMLGSEDYRYFTRVLQEAADRHSSGRLVALHEGGYSELYVPFCGLAVVEQLARTRSKVTDPYWADVSSFGYQSLQPHQDVVIQAAEQQLGVLRAAVKTSKHSSSGSSSSSKGAHSSTAQHGTAR